MCEEAEAVAEFAALMLPFLGTAAGSFTVFFMKERFDGKTAKLLTGFAAGVMIAASVWSLLIPAIEMNAGSPFAWAEAAAGFLCGVSALAVMKKLISGVRIPEGGVSDGFSRLAMLVLAITVHNFPEGMAVGVILAGAREGIPGITAAQVISLAVGIAVQNFPEGAIISMPLKSSGVPKMRSFLIGVLSGVVEPLGVLLTLAFTGAAGVFLPFLLSFAAGAMIHVVTDELIPDSESESEKNAVTLGTAAGFTLMMILDVALG